MIRLFLILILTLSTTSCISLVSEQAPETTLIFKRGLVKGTELGFLMSDCDNREWLPLTSRTSLLADQYERITQDTLPLSVYMEGWFSENGELVRLQMLGGDIATCNQLLSGVAVRAGGLEPVWYADVEGSEVRIHDSTRFRSWRLSDIEIEKTGAQWRWRSLKQDSKLPVLEIWREACVDPVGVWYALSSRVRVNDRTLRGCARYGDLQRMTLATKYYTRDPALLRQLGLALESDATLSLSLIDESGQSERYKGTWRLLGRNQLLINLERQGASSSRALVFKIEGTKLSLQGRDPLFGSGVELFPGPISLIDQLWQTGQLP